MLIVTYNLLGCEGKENQSTSEYYQIQNERVLIIYACGSTDGEIYYSALQSSSKNES